jgi:hypothetical protein
MIRIKEDLFVTATFSRRKKMHSCHWLYGLFITCGIKKRVSSFAHIYYIICHLLESLPIFACSDILEWLWRVLLRMSPSWPPSKSRLIQHPSLAMLTRDSLAGFPRCWPGLAWLGMACLDLNVDSKSQIWSTCKSPQIHITSKNNTNSIKIIYTAIHIFRLD